MGRLFRGEASAEVKEDWEIARKGVHKDLGDLAFEKGEDGRSRLVHKAEFDYGPQAPEPGAPVDEREVFMLFGAMWAEVLEWVYVPKNARLIGLRFKAVLYCCRPAMLGEQTLEQIATKEGITKSTFQSLTASFRDRFRIICRSMRSDLSREHMRIAALRAHAKRAKLKK